MNNRSHTVRMTRRQAAIIGAFTGVACGPFEDIHAYVDSLPGFKGIMTHNFASPEVWERIKTACKEDFLAVCSDRDMPDDVLSEREVTP